MPRIRIDGARHAEEVPATDHVDDEGDDARPTQRDLAGTERPPPSFIASVFRGWLFASASRDRRIDENGRGRSGVGEAFVVRERQSPGPDADVHTQSDNRRQHERPQAASATRVVRGTRRYYDRRRSAVLRRAERRLTNRLTEAEDELRVVRHAVGRPGRVERQLHLDLLHAREAPRLPRGCSPGSSGLPGIPST